MAAATSSFTQPPPMPYGRGLAAIYGVEDAAHVVSRALHRTEIAVTELHAKNPPQESDATRNALLVPVELKRLPVSFPRAVAGSSAVVPAEAGNEPKASDAPPA